VDPGLTLAGAMPTWEEAWLTGFSWGIGCKFKTAGVTEPEAGAVCRPDHSLMSSITAGSLGRVSTSTVPSDCSARGTWVGLLTRVEGT
jgi:hypothetical protein